MNRQAGRQAGVSGISSSPVARAISELETERQNLQARIAKVDEAIAALRALFNLPREAAAPASARPIAPRTSSGNSKGDTLTAIRAALADGPLSPGALATALGMDRPAVRYHLRALERDGVVTSTGSTADRRVALAASAAKEAL